MSTHAYASITKLFLYQTYNNSNEKDFDEKKAKKKSEKKTTKTPSQIKNLFIYDNGQNGAIDMSGVFGIYGHNGNKY